MVKIKFTAQGANALVGGFGPGDMANVSEALAQHLVEEARVARYVESGESIQPAAKPAKGKTKAKAAAAQELAPEYGAEETTAGN